MGYRVDRITITMDVYVEFEGHHQSTFSYNPDPGDELTALAHIKSEAILMAAKAEPITDILV